MRTHPTLSPAGRSLLALGAAAALLAGCSAPADYGDYERPPVDLPGTWLVDEQAAAQAANLEWWKQLGDPELDALIATALTENKDLRVATAVIEEFAGRAGISRSELYPQVGYSAGVGEDQRSLEDGRPLVGDEERQNMRYEVAGSVSWELDLWGRIARANEASLAELVSKEEDREAVALSLVSAVATTYLELLSLDRQLLITNETLAQRKALLDQFELKNQGGNVSGLELAQVRHAYQEVAIAVPRIELLIALKEHELSVLVGRNPGHIARGKALDALGALSVPAGIPSDVLARRPDIREQEQLLIAAHARMREVRTHYFPTIALTGLFGYSSTDIDDWLQESANLWSVGAGLVGPLFTGGRLAGEVQEVEAQREQLLQRYLGSIQNALREVDDSLVSVQKQRELLETERVHVETLQEYSTLAHQLYDAGLSSYLQVLDADRNLYNRRIEHSITMKDVSAALIASYKALGGGWEPPAAAAEAPLEE